MNKQINLRDLIMEGRSIQEKFNRRMVNEFSPMGEIGTRLEVGLTGFLDGYSGPGYAETPEGLDSISPSKSIHAYINAFAKKTDGTFSRGAEGVVFVDWNTAMDKSEANKIASDFAKGLEKLFNPYFYEIGFNIYTYKATGALGTSIGKGKSVAQLVATTVGEGYKNHEKFNKMRNALIAKSRTNNPYFDAEAAANAGLMDFLKKKNALVKKVDWVKEFGSELEKMVNAGKRSV